MQLTNASSIENNTGLSVHSFELSNSPHIFKVLYSSMYERKEEAVIRELACNARDALHKVGKFDVPVEITLPTEDAPELIVSDTGVGMSYEEVTRIYPNYGASTKRDNNTDIGGFGYGSKSPFALSPSFTVKTTKDGVTTTLSCFLDEGTPKFIPFTSGDVGNSDGTVISIPISSTEVVPRLLNAITSLFVLWDVKPVVHNVPNRSSVHTDVEIKDHGTWYHLVKGMYIGYRDLYVAVGPLLYRVPTVAAGEIRGSQSYKTFKRFLNCGDVIPKFEIGKLELAPSREFIEDTEENNKLIKEYFEIAASSLSERLLADPKDIIRNVYRIYNETVKIYDSTVVWVDNAKIEEYLKTVTKDYDSLILGYIQSQILEDTDLIVGVEKEGSVVSLPYSFSCSRHLHYNTKTYHVLNVISCLSTDWNLAHTVGVFSAGGNEIYDYNTTRAGSFRSRKVYMYQLSRILKNKFNVAFSADTKKLKAYMIKVNATADEFISVNPSDVVAFEKYLKDNKDTMVPFEIIDKEKIEEAWQNRPKPVRTKKSSSSSTGSTLKTSSNDPVLGVTHKGEEVTLTQLSDDTFKSKKLVVVTALQHKNAVANASSYFGAFADDIVVLALSKTKTSTKKVEKVLSIFLERENVHALPVFTDADLVQAIVSIPEIHQYILRLKKLDCLAHSASQFRPHLEVIGVDLLTEEEREIVRKGFPWYVARSVRCTLKSEEEQPQLPLRLKALLVGAKALSCDENSKMVDIFTAQELKELQKYVTKLRDFNLK